MNYQKTEPRVLKFLCFICLEIKLNVEPDFRLYAFIMQKKKIEVKKLIILDIVIITIPHRELGAKVIPELTLFLGHLMTSTSKCKLVLKPRYQVALPMLLAANQYIISIKQNQSVGWNYTITGQI